MDNSSTTPHPTPESQLTTVFEALKESVLIKKPVLRDILEKHGNKSLVEYANDYFDVNIGPGLRERQEEFFQTFHPQVSNLLGSDIADSAVQQLKKYYFVSTADHHGPLCDPFFLSSNLVTAISGLERSDPDFQNVIVLSCANVSLNNSSFPRGLLFSSYHDEKVQTHRLSFLPSNSHSSAVYNFRAYLSQEIDKVRTTLKEKLKAGHVKTHHAEKIHDLLSKIYHHENVLQSQNYSEQVTKTNFHLWRGYLGEDHQNPPNLIYLEQETLVVQLLLDHHLDQSTILNRIFFEPTLEPLILKYFNNISGAFSLENKWGTYLFWGISKDKNYRIPLWKQGEFLVSADGEYKIPLTPESIRQALEKKEILPSMLTIFFVLSLYYGLKCLGGFSQVNYLTFMKDAYIEMMKELGEDKEVALVEPVQTKEFGEDLTVAFLADPKGEVTMASGLDLILYHNKETFECMKSEAKIITLNEAIGPMMPSFYRVVYPGPERKDELMAITSQDIVKLTGLDKKIKPCVTIE